MLGNINMNSIKITWMLQIFTEKFCFFRKSSEAALQICSWEIVQSNFIEIALRYGCSSVNLLHIFRTSLPKNTSEGLLLNLLFNNFMVIS